ncbi:MAG: EF-hand domain-containing protein [Gammaproteobacteria bacterium]|nr:EF-hand domain-containing protein [Gammaproteobacteria bacterium]
MNDVNGIAAGNLAALGNLGALNGTSHHHAHGADKSRFLEDLFALLDTKNQGFIDKGEFTNALGKLDDGATGNQNPDQLFAKIDTNGDGKVTKQELSDVLATLDDQMKNMRFEHLRPPPPPAFDNTGMTQDQISTLASKIGGTDSGRAAVMRDLAANFATADANGDGRVTGSEADKYAQSHPVDALSGAAVANKTDKSALESAGNLVIRQLAQLLNAYGPFGAGTALKAVSSSLSALA